MNKIKKNCIIGMICIMVIVVIICIAKSSNITGTYVSNGQTILIYDNGEWSYHNDDMWAKERNISGNYSKVKSGTYKLESDKITFYVDINNENEIYVYSDDSDWESETFKKISDDIETEE